MRLKFSLHAERRMNERKISKSIIRKVIEAPDGCFFDTVTKHTIFIKRLLFREEERFIAVSTDQTEDQVVIVSVHPIRRRDYTSRIESGRWIKYE